MQGIRMIVHRLNVVLISCCVFLVSSGCSKARKIEGGSWSFKGAAGRVVVEDGRYYFGRKKKDPKYTTVTEYSKHACYFKFQLVNQTDQPLQIKTMGELLDKDGAQLESVMTNYYKSLAPGEEKTIEGFFGVTKKDVLQTKRFQVAVTDIQFQ